MCSFARMSNHSQSIVQLWAFFFGKQNGDEYPKRENEKWKKYTPSLKRLIIQFSKSPFDPFKCGKWIENGVLHFVHKYTYVSFFWAFIFITCIALDWIPETTRNARDAAKSTSNVKEKAKNGSSIWWKFRNYSKELRRCLWIVLADVSIFWVVSISIRV